MVKLPHQNDILSRRLHQLYIPGLADHDGIEFPISTEDVRQLGPSESTAGFLYLCSLKDARALCAMVESGFQANLPFAEDASVERISSRASISRPILPFAYSL